MTQEQIFVYKCPLTKYKCMCTIVYIETEIPNLVKGDIFMLEISNKTNLLEQKSYKYSLQDVKEPNLQRDIYSYGTIPKVAFNHRRVPMAMPEEIWITDTSQIGRAHV